MHWVIQNNIKREVGYDAFIESLDRQGISYDLVKVVPFSHTLIPDVNPKNPVIAIGAYTMEQISKKKGWSPGLYTNENFTYEVWSEKYKGHVLNDDAKVVSFEESVKLHYDEEVFIRPCKDGKEFAGMVTTWKSFTEWANRVLALEEDMYKTITKDTMIMIAPLKHIQREYRFFVVGSKVITGSQYKVGSRVAYTECTIEKDRDVYWFASRMASLWQPDRAFVIDIAMTPDGFKVIEINCMNGAGFYACDMAKVVNAIEYPDPIHSR